MRLRVHFQVFDETMDYGEITTASESSNVSQTPQKMSEATRASGYKGFQLSSTVDKPTSPLGKGYKFYEEYPGWISRVLSRASGEFPSTSIPTLDLEFSSESAQKPRILIWFDVVTGEHAVKLLLRLKTSETEDSWVSLSFYNDKPVCYIPIDVSYPFYAVQLQILKWSKPYSSAKVTLLDTESYFTIQGSSLGNVECSEQAWSSSFNLSTGIIQQYADVSFRDKNGLFATLSDGGALIPQRVMEIEVLYNSNWKVLGDYRTDKWSIDGVENSVKVSCVDPSSLFSRQTVTLKGTQMSVYDALMALEIKPKAASVVGDASLEDFLKTCICEDVYFQNEPKDKVIEQLCSRWMLKVFWQPQAHRFEAMEAW